MGLGMICGDRLIGVFEVSAFALKPLPGFNKLFEDCYIFNCFDVYWKVIPHYSTFVFFFIVKYLTQFWLDLINLGLKT